jgi:hypothetical protein
MTHRILHDPSLGRVFITGEIGSHYLQANPVLPLLAAYLP